METLTAETRSGCYELLRTFLFIVAFIIVIIFFPSPSFLARTDTSRTNKPTTNVCLCASVSAWEVHGGTWSHGGRTLVENVWKVSCRVPTPVRKPSHGYFTPLSCVRACVCGWWLWQMGQRTVMIVLRSGCGICKALGNWMHTHTHAPAVHSVCFHFQTCTVIPKMLCQFYMSASCLKGPKRL